MTDYIIFSLFFLLHFWNRIHIERYFILCAVTVYSKCNFLVHCCSSKLRIWVLFGMTEMQCSYHLNKFSCHFCIRLSFFFTTRGVQQWLPMKFLEEEEKYHKNMLEGRRQSRILSLGLFSSAGYSSHRTFGCLGIFSFCFLSSFPLHLPQPQSLSVK